MINQSINQSINQWGDENCENLFVRKPQGMIPLVKLARRLQGNIKITWNETIEHLFWIQVALGRFQWQVMENIVTYLLSP
jgi:hypothetical protein